jgi:hypothetical protein
MHNCWRAPPDTSRAARPTVVLCSGIPNTFDAASLPFFSIRPKSVGMLRTKLSAPAA